MSAAEIVSALFFRVMRYDPADAKNPNNDRFILSKGHAAPVLYAAWAEAGIIAAEELLTLRQFNSDLEGHPTPRLKWVDVATGSLGQGLSAGVGMALNAKRLDGLDYRTYVLMGDGETAEGGVWEAAALASYYQLDNLVAIVDVNRLGQSQPTMHGANGEAYRKKFDSFGWHAAVIDGHNLEQILNAFDEAGKTKGRPTALVALTKKGKGVSFLEDKEGWHGKPLKKGEETAKALRELPVSASSPAFEIAKPAKAVRHGPSSTQPLTAPEYKLGDLVATREAYGTALVKLGAVNPSVVAMDGDTKNSTFAEKFTKAYPQRYFEGFIAEQNLVGTAVGLSKCGKIPFVSTFGAFFGRAVDHLRMGAISRANIKCIGSHCGVSIGEDGPSQMALEDLALFRAIPDSVVFYPSDAVCTERLVALAADHQGIVYIRTSRPKTPVLYRNDEEFQIGGSKTLRSTAKDRLTIVAAGVTVVEALKAHDALAQEIAVRVVDAYCVKPIDAKGLREAAKESGNTLVVVEEHYFDGGLGDAVLNAIVNEGVRVHKLAIREIPRSGKPEELLDRFGISAAQIIKKVKELS
jgi:transketolase